MLQLAQALKSQVPNIGLPLASIKKDIVILPGMAMIKKGKLIGTLKGKQTEDVLMLSNVYKSGILQVPCAKRAKDAENYESIEIHSVSTKLKPDLKSAPLKVQASVRITGNIGELKCTKLEKREDLKKFEKKVRKQVKKQLQETIQLMQKEKIDLIGLGNQIYRNNPKLWKVWKKDWDKRYSEAKFEVKVDIIIGNTLTVVGKPVSAK
jgi:spore germination protein KC